MALSAVGRCFSEDRISGPFLLHLLRAWTTFPPTRLSGSMRVQRSLTRISHRRSPGVEANARRQGCRGAIHRLAGATLRNREQPHFWGETDVGLETTTRLAKQFGINTLLKPHIWLRRSSGGKRRSDIEMESEAEWRPSELCCQEAGRDFFDRDPQQTQRRSATAGRDATSGEPRRASACK